MKKVPSTSSSPAKSPPLCQFAASLRRHIAKDRQGVTPSRQDQKLSSDVDVTGESGGGAIRKTLFSSGFGDPSDGIPVKAFVYKESSDMCGAKIGVGNLGELSITPSWLKWRGNCGRCKKILKDPVVGIFCSNFSSRRGRFGACYSCWCPQCYRSCDSINFPKVIPEEDGVVMPCKEDELFDVARPGDTLMTAFQCDLCHFRNIKSRNPVRGNPRDERALVMIRRANLDSFWARTSATVRSNLSDFRQFIKHSTRLWGEVPNLPARGPFALEDFFGMTIACATLSRSLDKGKNAEHIQFNTARRVQAAYANYWNASIYTLDTGVFQGGQAKMMVTACPVYHTWYNRMMKGMHERMGDLVVQDQAVSRELQKAIMDLLEMKLVKDHKNRRQWVEIGTFVMLLWLGALRGNEGMMLSLDGCKKMMKASAPAQLEGEKFGIAVLQGKFKTSTGYTRYMMYLSSETKTQFQTTFRGWLTRLLDIREKEGKDTGWMFTREDGSQMEMTHYEDDILRLIVEVQDTTEGIIPMDLDVFDRYGVFRSWRRGATSVARNEGWSKSDIELNNWWRKAEESRGKHVGSDMLANYTEDLLMIDAKQRFSAAL